MLNREIYEVFGIRYSDASKMDEHVAAQGTAWNKDGTTIATVLEHLNQSQIHN